MGFSTPLARSFSHACHANVIGTQFQLFGTSTYVVIAGNSFEIT